MREGYHGLQTGKIHFDIAGNAATFGTGLVLLGIADGVGAVGRRARGSLLLLESVDLILKVDDERLERLHEFGDGHFSVVHGGTQQG